MKEISKVSFEKTARRTAAILATLAISGCATPVVSSTPIAGQKSQLHEYEGVYKTKQDPSILINDEPPEFTKTSRTLILGGIDPKTFVGCSLKAAGPNSWGDLDGSLVEGSCKLLK